MGREDPRPTDELAGADRLDDQRAGGRVDLQRDLPGPQHEELVRRIVLGREELADLDDTVAAATSHEVEVPLLQAGQHRLLRQQVADRRRSHAGSSPLMARTSSVRSIAAGHQEMQRPQPTQPDSPNWSHQVESLWVSHCR